MKISAIILAAASFTGLVSCESTKETAGHKPRPKLPGDEIDEKSWNRPTRGDDFASPMGGMPMSR